MCLIGELGELEDQVKHVYGLTREKASLARTLFV